MNNHSSLFIQERAASVERTTVKVIGINLISIEALAKNGYPSLLKIAKNVLQVELVFLNFCFKSYLGCSPKLTRQDQIFFSFYNMSFEIFFM